MTQPLKQIKNGIVLDGSLPSDVTYDKYGRMQYHPSLHSNQMLPWTTTDQKYLIDNYELLGPEEVSLGLERTIHTVMTRAYQLRKSGLMSKRTLKRNHKRLKVD